VASESTEERHDGSSAGNPTFGFTSTSRLSIIGLDAGRRFYTGSRCVSTLARIFYHANRRWDEPS
jgi:hypothetical protein